MAIDRVTLGGLEQVPPPGARLLGQRVKPIVRLGMGVKHPEKGYPMKTDHFTIRGDERVIGKFREVYGEKPKAVKIMVPSSLGLALDISYKSFVGGGDSEDGGRPLALGTTNFATVGYVGGPDVVRVWKQDGSYMEVETDGLDELGKPLDEIANDLKLEVHTTFTFTIPDVLGWGSFCQITSKGKKSADNLAFKLTEIYSAFGSKAPWAFDRAEPPLLVLKPDTALMRFEDKDTNQARWGKSKIFVLDIVIPESFDDMRDRLLERQRELEGRGGAIAELYPGSNGDTEPPTTSSTDDGAGDAAGRQAAATTEQATPTAQPGAAAPGTDDEEVEEAVWTAVDDEPEIDEAAVAKAAESVVKGSVYDGHTFAEVAAGKDGADGWTAAAGATWFLVQLKKTPADSPGRPTLETFVRARLPKTWSKYEAWKAEQS